MKKSILAAFLALVLVLTPLAACTKKAEDGANGDGAVTDEGQGAVVDPDNRLSSEYSPNIPEADSKLFEGKTFSMLIGSTGQSIYAEEENGTLINDTVYRRNKLVEDRFDITLNIVKTGAASTGEGQREATSQFRSLIESGDQTYNAFIHVQHTGMPKMILEKYFVDWNELPYINLSDEWWYENITNDLCFGDKIYVMTGDYALYIDKIDCLLFNKDIFDELGLEYPTRMCLTAHGHGINSQSL